MINPKARQKAKKESYPLYTFLDDKAFDPIVPYSNRYNLTTASITETSIVKDEAVFKAFGASPSSNNKILAFESPYKQIDLWRMHDVYKSDGAVCRGINTLTQFILGDYTKLVIDTNSHYKNEDEQDAAVQELNNNEEYQKLLEDCNKINKKVDLNKHLIDAVINKKIYGKAAILIERNDANIPFALKTLSSQLIGKVFAWDRDYSLAGIEYADFPENERIVKADRLMYFVNKDSHVSPRTLWNGISDLEPVLDVAETSIINRQTNIKEINRKLWAALMVIKVFSKSKAVMEKFKLSFQAGKTIVVNQDFDVQVHQIAHDLEQLLKETEINDKKIARDLEIPELLMGWEDTQNRATANALLLAWTSSKLKFERTLVRDTVEKHYIDKNVKALVILNGGIQSLGDLQQYTEKYDITSPNFRPVAIDSALANPATPGRVSSDAMLNFSMDDLVVAMLPFVIKLTFGDITLDSFLDKAAATIGLKNASIIDDFEMALELLGLQKYIPKMRQYSLEQEAKQQAIFGQQNQAYLQMKAAEGRQAKKDQQQGLIQQGQGAKGGFGSPRQAHGAQDVQGLPGIDKTGGKTSISARRGSSGGSDGGGGGKYLKIG
jgi:hypothetical protein